MLPTFDPYAAIDGTTPEPWDDSWLTADDRRAWK